MTDSAPNPSPPEAAAMQPLTLSADAPTYFDLFHANPQPMWIYDQETLAFLVVNQAAIDGYGYTQAEFLGMTLRDIRPPEDAPALMQLVNDARLAVTVSVPSRHLRKDGSLREVEISSHPIKVGNRNARFVLASDITEGRRLREALAASSALLERAGEMARFGGWELDLLTQRVNWSNETCRIYEVQPGQVQTFDQAMAFLAQSERDRLNQLMQAAIANRTPFDVEVPVTTAKGRDIWIRAHATVQWQGDTPVKINGAVQDITERYLAQQALTAGDMRFHDLLQNVASVSVQSYGPDGTTQFWNGASEQLYGYSANEAIGNNLVDLIIPPEMREGVQAAMAHMVATGQGIPAEELLLQRKDGSRVPVFSSHAVVQMPGREPEVFCVDIDLTALKQEQEKKRLADVALRAVSQGVIVTGPDRRILSVNAAFESITGYTEAQVVGRTTRFLQGPMSDQDTVADIRLAMDTAVEFAGDILNYRQDGVTFWNDLTITPVHDAQGQLTHFIGVLRDITARKAAEEQIRNLAFYDALTGLPNRRLLMDRLKQAMAASARRENHAALLFVDLDNFKTLNDTLGHDQGDLLLQQVALRLSTCIRDGDTVARLGGDEFVVMLEDLHENALEAATQAETVGEKLLHTLNRIYELGSYAHHSTPSIGITLFGEIDESIEEPLKRADLAMYQAKAAGRNTLRFFDPQMQAIVSARAALEVDLRSALQRHEFVLYYQPQIAGVDADHLSGAEALVRWQHPTRGLVPPAEFIPLTEETGLILPLGKWVLEQACQQLAQWASRPDMAHLTIAVNVSALQFHQRDFVHQVLDALQQTGASASHLKLELTEGLLVTNVEDVIAKMGILKAAGVGFSLDDFGTGYSSLSHLKRLPLNQLKIDQSFVRDILSDTNDAAISKMIIALADSLNLSVIAEGVETQAQREFLSGQGCHAYQGYFFSKPLPIEAFERFAAGFRS